MEDTSQPALTFMKDGVEVDAWGNTVRRVEDDEAAMALAAKQYRMMTVKELTEEIHRREAEGRVFDRGSIKKKADAVAALEADDEAMAEYDAAEVDSTPTTAEEEGED